LVITVTAVDNLKDVAITVGKTNSMQEVVDQINAQGGDGLVKASLNDAGKLVLSNNTGATIKKREESHKMADANKAFAHYRW